MNRRALGTVHLNALLQQALNPARPGNPELTRGEKCLREGDHWGAATKPVAPRPAATATA